MTRYDELMDRVRVTPEMRDRVLKNVAAAEAVPSRRQWKRYAAVAACLTLVILGCLTLPKMLSPSEDPGQVMTTWQREEFDSVGALSDAAGFRMPEIPTLADTATERSYALISGNLAEIVYACPDGEYCLRAGPDGEDVSGDYNEYPVVKTADSSGRSVTLKGEADTCRLALWSDDGHAFALSFPDSCSFEEALALVDAVQ